MSLERWFYINVHFACYGIGAQDGTIFFAPPIAAWMIGKTLLEVKPYLIQHKAEVIELKHGQDNEGSKRFIEIAREIQERNNKSRSHAGSYKQKFNSKSK